MEPHGPVARGGDLVVFQIQELVGRHVVGQDIAAVGLEHGGEDDAVEHDIVLADEVHETCLGIFPPLLPRSPALGIGVAEFLGVADIANGGVEPHIEHLSLGALYGHGDSPVEVAGHGAGLQVHVEPALALAVNIGAPLLMFLQDPLLQPLLVFVERQIPVLGLAHHGFGSADGGVRVDEFHRREIAAALLALVAVGVGVAAVGALAHDVSVGKELVGFLVVILFRFLLDEFAIVVKFAEEVGGKFVVYFGGGTAVDVEGDAKLLKRVLDEFVVAVADILWRTAFLLGTYGDGHAVLIATADEDHVLALEAQVPGIDIGWHIDAGHVPDVDTTVGIRQSRSHCGALEFLLFHDDSFVFPDAKIQKNPLMQ